MVYTRSKRATHRQLQLRGQAARSPAQRATPPAAISSDARPDFSHSKARSPNLDFTDEPVDICAHIFDVCKRCQAEHLNWRRINCLFDVDSGTLPGDVASRVGVIVESLIADIAHHQVTRYPGATINITMRHKGGQWILAVSENVNGFTRQGVMNRRLAMIRGLAQRLDAQCSGQLRSNGTLIAVMFQTNALAPAEMTATSTLRPLH